MDAPKQHQPKRNFSEENRTQGPRGYSGPRGDAGLYSRPGAGAKPKMLGSTTEKATEMVRGYMDSARAGKASNQDLANVLGTIGVKKNDPVAKALAGWKHAAIGGAGNPQMAKHASQAEKMIFNEIERRGQRTVVHQKNSEVARKGATQEDLRLAPFHKQQQELKTNPHARARARQQMEGR